MTIIIETPAPPTRERLVLVPEESCTPVFNDGKPAGLSIRAQGARDATPEDLARAGYVPAFSDLEASRDPPMFQVLVDGEHFDDFDTEDSADRAARSQVESMSRGVVQVMEVRTEYVIEPARSRTVTKKRLGPNCIMAKAPKCQLWCRAQYAETVRERDEAKELARVLEVERDTLRAELADAKAECQGAMLSAYAQYAETVRERDEARRLHSAAVTQVNGAEHEARTLRAELARLTAPVEGRQQPEMPPPDNSRILSSGLTEAVEVELMGIVDDAIGRLDSYGDTLVCRGAASGVAHTVALDAYRLGVAHERARQQPAPTFVQATGTHTFGGRPRSGQGLPPDAQPDADRATDEELVEVAKKAMDACRAGEFPLIPIALAVAARVRQERCLVTRAVGMLADVSLARHPQRGLGERTYTIRVQCPAEPNAIAAAVPAADVPATLARLLGEVER